MRLGKTLWLMPCLLGLTVSVATAADLKSADAVIAKYIEAIGGRSKLDAIKTMRINGKVVAQGGMEMPITLELKRPNKARFETVFQGMTMTQAYDGTSGWMVMPFTGNTEPEKLPEEQAKQLAKRADMDGPLVDYKKKGHTVELEGTDEVEGTPVYKLKVAEKNGDVDYFLIDKEHFLPIAMKTKTNIQGTEAEVEVVFGDYKPVNGVIMAHSVTQKAAMFGESTMTFTEIKANVDLPDERFVMPESGGESEDQ